MKNTFSDSLIKQLEYTVPCGILGICLSSAYQYIQQLYRIFIVFLSYIAQIQYIHNGLLKNILFILLLLRPGGCECILREPFKKKKKTEMFYTYTVKGYIRKFYFLSYIYTSRRTQRY